MRILISILLLTAGAQVAATYDDKPGKEAYDSWSNQYVSLHNSAITLKELMKRLKIWNALESAAYGTDELGIKIPKVSYLPAGSEFKFTNGMSVKVKDALAREYVIDGKSYILPEDMLKFYADKKPQSKLTGCLPREKASHMQHATLLPFATAAAHLIANYRGGGSNVTCETQVKLLRTKMKSGKFSLVALGCDPGGYRYNMDVKVEKSAANIHYNTWAATYDVITGKDKVTFLPNGKMRLGSKLCAPDFDKYKVLRKLVDPVEPMIREMMVSGFCQKCGTSEWISKLTEP